MRGAGVEHARRAVRRDQCDGLSRGLVGQAQDHEVDLVDDRALRGRILRAVARQARDLDVVARGEALPDLEPGRPVLAIDVDRRPGHRAHSTRILERSADAVSFTSARAQALASCCSTFAASAAFFSPRSAWASPNSAQPLPGLSARSARYTASASAYFLPAMSDAPWK